jgi:hypothetical protein
MSSSTMRSLVRSVISEVPMSHGAQFADDVVQNFFTEIKSLVQSAFGALDEEVKSYPGKSASWKEKAMAKGLAFIGSNEATIIDTVADSDDACLTLTNMYFSAMNRFLRAHVSRRDLMSVNIIPFGKFIATLYRKLAHDPNMKSGAFFNSMSYSEKDSFLADTLRKVMQESVNVNLTSSASTTSNASVFSNPITPSDSVSNINFTKPPSRQDSVAPSVVMGKSVAAKAMQAAVVHAEEDKSRASKQPSRFSSFKQASVIGDAKTKVITVSKIDRHALPPPRSSESYYSSRESRV